MNNQLVIETLLSYSQLLVGWDGYDGITPLPAAIQDAIAFIKLLPDHIIIPRPMASGNGEVGLYLDNNQIYADIGFMGDYTYSAFIINKLTNDKWYLDDVILSVPLPATVLQLLRINNE